MAELSLVDVDIFLLILKNDLPILLLHLAEDDDIESLAEMCGVRNETKRKNLTRPSNQTDFVFEALPNEINCLM